MAFVIDASVTMAWCFEDEASDEADAVLGRLLEEGALAPGLWSLDVANVLIVAERRKRITEAQSSRFLKLLADLPIHLDVNQPSSAAVASIARRHGISAYDAAYLELAEQRGLPLATLDSHLGAAALSAGVGLVLST